MTVYKDTYSKAQLVIDCNKNQVYLKRGNHAGNADYYFIGNERESHREGWKYQLCTAVIDQWSTIREELEEEFGDCQSVLELCESFSV